MPGKRTRSYSTKKGSFKKRRSSRYGSQIFHPGNGTVRVKHREFIKDLYAYNSFHREDFVLNAGLETTFQFLHQIALAYEVYNFTKLRFIYKPTFSDITTTGSGGMGSVVMCTQYNIAEDPLDDKRDMENRDGAISFKPSVKESHYVRVNDKTLVLPRLFVRTGDGVEGDRRMMDMGRFSIAVMSMDLAGGQEGIVAIGELWVEYDVILSKPRYNNVIYSDLFFTTNITNANPTIAPLGTGAASDGGLNGSTLGGTISANGKRYIFPPHIRRGRFLLSYTVTGTAVNPYAAGTTNGVNCFEELFFEQRSSKEGGTINGQVTTPKITVVRILRVTAAGASWGYTADPNYPTGDTATLMGELFVTELSDKVE